MFQFGGKQLRDGRSGELAALGQTGRQTERRILVDFFLDLGRVVGMVSLPTFSDAGYLRRLRQADL